ncbi:hypothetical protein CRV08_07495 [Halarcobacter ebronensis]|uniref:Uncharacterized protein n=1 Tax=Halarcobacter ebronensis TaxID=1462615 RepID=A0A4Q0YDU5_9BACT|nr:hypothetical protein [Halarcobacter ebronensis]RXJ68656.1 hypothetical protein CRV08_07495 [Halarcobacter ebronensis]
MNYKKELIEMIVEELLNKTVSKKIIKKFEPKSLLGEEEKLIHNTKLLQELESLELDFELQTLTSTDLKRLIGKDMDQKQVLDLCQSLKCINFTFDYVCKDSYTMDFYNYFNEVMVSISRTGLITIKLLMSDKILLKDNQI